jgi:hypothetical protein
VIFPHNVPGWLTEAEGNFLYRQACLYASPSRKLHDPRPSCALEIGSFEGRSSICIAQGVGTLLCVDPFDGRGTAHPDEITYYKFLEHICDPQYGIAYRVKAFVGTSDEICPILHRSHRCSFAFIDGAHDFANVINDARHAASLMAVPKDDYSVAVAFHDYHSPVDPEVKTAVDYLINAEGWKILDNCDSIILLRPNLESADLLNEDETQEEASS